MRIFGYAVDALFSVTMAIIAAFYWERDGLCLGVIIPGGLALAGMIFLVTDAASLKPKSSRALPTGFYQVLAISPETNPGHGRIVVLKRWPDEKDEYGSPQILCVRLDSEHETMLMAVGAELELMLCKGKVKFARAPVTVET